MGKITVVRFEDKGNLFFENRKLSSQFFYDSDEINPKKAV